MSPELYYLIATPLILISAIATSWNAVLQTRWYIHYRKSHELK